jgi:hypothetical protein
VSHTSWILIGIQHPLLLQWLILMEMVVGNQEWLLLFYGGRYHHSKTQK